MIGYSRPWGTHAYAHSVGVGPPVCDRQVQRRSAAGGLRHAGRSVRTALRGYSRPGSAHAYSRGTHVRAVLMRTVVRDPSPVASLYACVLRQWRGVASPPHALHRARDAVTRAVARGAATRWFSADPAVPTDLPARPLAAVARDVPHPAHLLRQRCARACACACVGVRVRLIACARVRALQV